VQGGLRMDSFLKLRKADAKFILALYTIHGSNRTLRGISKYLNLDYVYCCKMISGLRLKGATKRQVAHDILFFTKPERGDVFIAIKNYYKVSASVAAHNEKMFLERFKKEIAKRRS